MTEHSEGKPGIQVEKLKEARVWMSILGAIIVAGYSGFTVTHAAYVNYHDKRYLLRGEVLAQVAEVDAKATQALQRSQDNAEMLKDVSSQQAQLSNNFALYSAMVLVNQARAELRAVEASEENSAASRALKNTLSDRLRHAEEFKQCVVDNKPDCNMLIQQ